MAGVAHGDNRMYITSGLGVSILPVRFDMRPEWVMFTLAAPATPATGHESGTMKFDAVLFDCDGVLVDSEPITNGVLRDMLEERG